MEETASLLPTQSELQRYRDSKRNRALYRYLEPENLDATIFTGPRSISGRGRDAPTVARSFEPMAQLVALRCKAQKVMINVMDGKTMYFLAEATTTSSEVDGLSAHVLTEDPIFLGCSGVPVQGRICELTLRENTPTGGHPYPVFEVKDLSADPRFSSLPVVAGKPYYRYYAGVPITTDDGINIGSVAFMDLKSRELSVEEEKCLGQVAEHVMNLLETNRLALYGRRSKRLTAGLDAFMAGKGSLDLLDSVVPGERVESAHSTVGAYGVLDRAEKTFPDGSPGRPPPRTRTTGQDSSQTTSDESDASRAAVARQKTPEDDNTGDSVAMTLQRAASLIRESLNLSEDGGCIFFEEPAQWQSINSHFGENPLQNLRDQPILLEPIAAATYKAESLKVLKSKVGLPKMEVRLFQRLLHRYPTGHSWTLDELGLKLSSSSDEDQLPSTNSPKPGHVQRLSSFKAQEEKFLDTVFPGARSVLFYPLLDVLNHRKVSCFLYDTSETQFLGSQHLTFVASFCNTTKAECQRIEAVRADIQKDRFVSTISHEMRSPLHGVLASVEFLEDTSMDSSQKALVDSIGACGRTLLDTIDMILSYAKIASFERSWQAQTLKRRRNHGHHPSINKTMSSAAPQMLQLYAPTDLSVLLEEVLDGVSIGHTYRSKDDDLGQVGSSSVAVTHGDPSESKRPIVEVIVDVQKADWIFLTAPGSIRRILMNIFGNSTKYTSHGSITVQLQLKDVADFDLEPAAACKMMVLTITDTGKGMSPEYLATKLFTAFAQGDPLSPGTGLGLSIVRSIVKMLGGTVKVSSTLGVGTIVQVLLPMSRLAEGSGSSELSQPTVTPSRSRTISNLKNRYQHVRVALFKMNSTKEKQYLHDTLTQYLRDWFGLDLQDDIKNCDIVVLEDEDFEEAMQYIVTHGLTKRCASIVLCDPSSWERQRGFEKQRKKNSNINVVLKPCGPHKLAAAIHSSLEESLDPEAARSHGTTLRDISTKQGQTDNFANHLHELVLRSPDRRDEHVVQASETLAAKASRNAQMAITTPNTIDGPQQAFAELGSFPFPDRHEHEDATQKERAVARSSGSSIENGKYMNGVASTSISLLSPRGPRPNPSASTPHVLLVDDNKINLQLLQTFMRKRNYTNVSSAEDGQQALSAVQNAAQNYPFDIIFMDISMPLMNGFEATRAIRTHEQKIHERQVALIIALTGLASEKDQADAFSAGCDLYMTKPVRFREVGALLDNWASHRLPVNGGSNGIDKAGMALGSSDQVVANGH